MILCYVLITYGKKCSGSLWEHAEGADQLGSFGRFLAASPGLVPKYFSDYRREIRRVDDLPKFSWMLRKLEQRGSGLLFIDDLHRIFRRTPEECRGSLLFEMRGYGSNIFSIRHRKRLSEFSDAETTLLLMRPEKVKRPQRRSGRTNTEKARVASVRSRAERAVETGNKIKALQDELLDTADKVTLQMVADQANERGMRTATGQQWTRQTVARALEAAQRSDPE